MAGLGVEAEQQRAQSGVEGHDRRDSSLFGLARCHFDLCYSLPQPNRWHNVTCWPGRLMPTDWSPMPSATTTPVEIFGEVYHVRGDDENGYLQDLADLVDRKMREVAEHVK